VFSGRRDWSDAFFAPQALTTCLQKEIPTRQPVDETSMKSNIQVFLTEVRARVVISAAEFERDSVGCHTPALPP
jgi:hypothetical protein